MTSNPPQSAGLAAKQAAAAAAARFAGYSSFYASPSPPAQPHNQTQFFQPARPPPPRPGMFNGPRGPPPRPPHMTNGFARPPPPPQFALNGRGPPPMMRPPPRPASSQSSSSQWQWSNGSNVQTSAPAKTVAAAPPVRFNISPQNRGPPPRSFGPPPGAFSAPNPAAPAAASPMGGNAKWPDALHDYVKRAFARCKGAADQSITQNSLKEMITNAIMTNSLWTKNWTAEPLPVLVGDTPAAAMQTKMGMGGPMPGAAGQKFTPSPSSSSLQSNQIFIPFKEPSSKKNKANKRKHDGFEIQDADVQRKNQRRQRFHMTQQELKSLVTPEVDTKKLQVLTQDGDLDLAAMVIKGTSQTVEKEYLRLTSPPHPSTVRPEPVLHKALELVKSKWKKGDRDYIYACSQLKSIRQDCTVQHIKNAFTVSVYETHARVALESGDINEFNQCQTQLHELYEKLIPGEAIEFLAYRILYCVYVSLQAKKGDSNAGQLGMYNVLGMVTPRLRADPTIAHALRVRQAVAMNDYHRFFKLYVDAPNMAGYLMDVMVPAIRLSALRAMCKAYRPTLPVQYIRDELKLEGKAGKAFIRQSGIAFVKGDKSRVDTKASNIVWALSNESSLI
ncbi:Leukocyte receptor cluster member 8 [Phytophthora nicotianae]|uniref:Leukocyte receptor cluster member 8 n=1 Tax=Phytophthora nicotianae TaxID=4792 RepID=A0A0W8CMU5_PHYNI|nr:Leukocyte receptor cluster member 8 [Phytophthora nicotianae]KUF85348.1 Leukocyte receptor cluster member 8 [Phytophthora nicotianae]